MPPKTKPNGSGSTPATKEAWFARGEKLEESGEHEEALAAFQAALALDPAWTYPRFRAAQILAMDLGRWEESIALVDATPPGIVDSDLTFVRGRALADLGRIDEAVAAYQKALDEEEANEASANDRSDILCALSLDLRSRVPEALGYAESACAANPANAHAWECVGYFQYLSGALDLAVRSLRLAVAIEGKTMADTLRSDPDFGGFREDPRFQAALAAPEMPPETIDRLYGLWQPGGHHAALTSFLDRLEREKLLP